jgi:hypothetical protein
LSPNPSVVWTSNPELFNLLFYRKQFCDKCNLLLWDGYPPARKICL